MKPIHFRGQNYDPQVIARLAGQGHRQTIPTKDIISLISVKAIDVRVAVMVEGKYHLLTGQIEQKYEQNEVVVISKPVLKKALVQEQTYAERRREQLDHRDWRQSMGASAGWGRMR